MKVIFDFDDVIFNAKEFKSAIFQILEGKGYERVQEKYEVMRGEGGAFSLKIFLRNVDPTLSFEEEESLYQQILGFSELLINQEVLNIIRCLEKDNCYIVSSGFDEFQKDKIRRCVGENLVSEIIVVEGNKGPIIEAICKRHEREDVIFVDDKLEHFGSIKMNECENLKTVLFNEHGLENLKAEIEVSKIAEATRGLGRGINYAPQAETSIFNGMH